MVLIWLLLAGFGDGKRQFLILGDLPMGGAEETYSILSQIPTLTKLSLAGSKITALPEGNSRIPGLTYCLNLLRSCGCTISYSIVVLCDRNSVYVLRLGLP